MMLAGWRVEWEGWRVDGGGGRVEGGEERVEARGDEGWSEKERKVQMSSSPILKCPWRKWNCARRPSAERWSMRTWHTHNGILFRCKNKTVKFLGKT